MLYLSEFRFAGENDEFNFFTAQRRTCYDSYYPFQVFPDKGLRALAAYRDGLVAQFETYKDDFPVGYEQNKAGRVVVKGDYVVLALAGADVDYADVDAAIEEAMP